MLFNHWLISHAGFAFRGSSLMTREKESEQKHKSNEAGHVIAALIGAAVVGAAWLFTSWKRDTDDAASSPPPHAVGNTTPSATYPLPNRFHDHNVDKAGDNEQNIVCCVCLDNKANCMLEPCNHVKLCCKCAKEVSTCPVCRSAIVGRVGPVFL